jgi:ribosomal protection tetracycline resistance protein
MSEVKIFLNIGILAHVDAGKTSITELMLYKSGQSKKLGSVDKGTSQTDWLEIEKQRGISVRAASASFIWNEWNINIIDTPGHIDFSSEVERSLPALDGALLVLSAVEGVQAHSGNIWFALRKLGIPTFIFINKIDRVAADTGAVLNDIKNELSPHIIELQSLKNQASKDAEIETFDLKDEKILETLVEHDDKLLQKYLNDESISKTEIKDSLKEQIKESKIFPILYGSAKYDIGIDILLDYMSSYLPPAGGDDSAELAGIVFKVEHNKTHGKMASVRLFNGCLKNRDTIDIPGIEENGKISRIMKSKSNKLIDTGILKAGDSGIICGLPNIKAGDTLGKSNGSGVNFSLNTPLLTLRVYPENDKDYSELIRAIHILNDEDPALGLIWMRDERELHIKVTGLIQIEVLKSILENRFRLRVQFGKPTVIYKETPISKGEAYEEYTMPKPCWAVVKFMIEPLERGSGLVFESKVGINYIEARYQKEIERTIPLALKQGNYGWEVTDLKITLIDGEHHNIHSRAGDFAIATPMAILKGLKNTGTQLLEPMLDFSVSAPEEYLGKISSNLKMLRANFANPEIINSRFTFKGKMPLSNSLDYSATLSSMTGGKAKFRSSFGGYRECSIELGATTPFRGISPLDRAKYILKARKAL